MQRHLTRTRTAFVVILFGLLCWPMVALSEESHTWAPYKNARYGFSIEYPSDLFTPDEPPFNNAGRSFQSKDGKAQFSVWGSANALEQSLDEYRTGFMEVEDYSNVTYQPKGSNWFVLSGVRGDRIFYEKVILSCRNETVNTLRVYYPTVEKARYDKIVTRLEETFRTGPGIGDEDCE